MAHPLTADDFAPHIGKTFTPLGQHRALTLAAVERQKHPGAELLPREPFILIFSGPPDDLLPEGLYDTVVQDGPEFQLYIGPIQTFARDRQDYQSVFN